MKRVGVIGAGRFGMSLAESLSRRGAEVVLLDNDRETVHRLASIVTKAVEGDASDMRALAGAGMQDCDTAVVAIGTDMEGSILATMNLKELKVPYIVAKAGSDRHGIVLERIGADLVVYPNKERAERLARSLLARSELDYFEISDGVSVVEMAAPGQFVGKTLLEGNIRQRHGVTVLAIKRGPGKGDNQESIFSPAADEVVREDDILVLFGPDKKLDALS